MIVFLSLVALFFSAIPALMWLANLPLFRPRECIVADGSNEAEPLVPISVLIPARDEADGIEACIRHALESEKVAVEVIVLDDDSSDDTADIVRQIALEDQRVRLVSGKPLPDGWNGKQHACKQLSDEAKHRYFAFIDADVRLKPRALYTLHRLLRERSLGLISAFPFQVTVTWLEQWLIPMMHFILLSYLPFSRMRLMKDPSLAAGCGQLFLTERKSYVQAGTHEAIQSSRHDGIKLPRAFRQAGLMTDVVDGTNLASCRMYQNAEQVLRGVLKNAVEGIANPRLIGVFTVLLLGCSVLPVLSLLLAIQFQSGWGIALSLLSIAIAHVPRALGVVYFRQPIMGAASHIPATVLFVILQWVAFWNHLMGRTVAWRGRS
ncbi:glycosyltransferase [Stieleria sp. JC731]|uniref:glycosyltransferase n=1 Tax=Pirellulaceae TaxID=2691357 RepID=UPI001E371128|nr:glycosyltransferase [Stieleria sp. JC731]MCC9602528.1 glycosyltransferase [Stieleria sp. JC731]